MAKGHTVFMANGTFSVTVIDCLFLPKSLHLHISGIGKSGFKIFFQGGYSCIVGTGGNMKAGADRLLYELQSTF